MKSQPTTSITHTIISYLQAGGTPTIAAQAAGIEESIFLSWLKQGKGESAKKVFREFATAVEKAYAQARLRAEVSAFNDKPLEWLKSGPARGDYEWGAKSSVRKEITTIEPNQQSLQQMLQMLLEVLLPFPEARKAVALAFEKENPTI